MKNKKMKKFLMILCSICILFLCGCQQKNDTVSMYDLRQKMEAADSSFPEMLNASSEDKEAEDLFLNISDLDYKKVDSFFVSYAAEGGKADEIAVIAVKDTADTDEAKKSLEAHKESRRKLLDQYEPEEVSRIEDGVIFTSGQYAVFIVSEHAADVRRAFEEAIKS